MGGRVGLASVVLVALGVGLAHAEPLRIRAAWVAPISDWVSIWLDKKDLAVHYGKSYVLESVHYNGTPSMITAMANGELEIAMLGLLDVPDCGRECRDGRHARDRRRVPGWRRGLLLR